MLKVEYIDKLIRKYPKSPVPYFYSAQWHLHQVNSNDNVKFKYKELGITLSHFRKFKKYFNDDASKGLAHQALTDSINQTSKRTFALLLEQGDSNRYNSLKMKYDRIFETQNKIEIIVKKEENNIEMDLTSRFKNKQFFGMPNGTEVIEPLNTKVEAEMLMLINKERVKQGMQPLKLQPELVNAARYHATDMATQNYFNHDSYDSLNNELALVGHTFDRIRKFYNDRFVNSENIAAGNSTAEDTYYQWFTSKGHYENMFNKESKLVGIAMAYSPSSTFRYYWVFCTAR